MGLARDIYNHNRKAASQYKLYLRIIPKVIAIYSADSAIAGVMQPNAKNYTAGEKPSGNFMPHSSSNAAWNWRIGFGSEESPLYEKEKDPVGHEYEERSTHNVPAALDVVKERRIKDVNGKLYRKLFSVPSAKMPKISIYNNIDKLNFGKPYVDRSNVKAASKQLQSYAMSGAQLSYGLIKSYMRSGKGRMPDPQGLLAALQKSQSDHFVKWI